jgi:uncharacterized protein (DUF362 family)
LKTKVYIIKKKPKETVQEVVLRTLKMVPLKARVTDSEKKILINPNWVCNDHSDSGNVTSTDTLEGILTYLIDEAKISPDKIVVADGGDSSTTQATMKLNDVFRLEEYDIKVTDLNKDDRINNLAIPNPLVLKKVNLAKTAWNASCIISVPSLKTHSMAETTLSMKNLMGSLLPKNIMHSNLHEKIADLTSLLRDKMKFQIIDGIIASDGSEIGGSPVRMDLIVAGEDPVAVDCVGSAIIGYSPKKAKYLKFAEKKGLGTANMDDIEIVGANIEDVYRKF